LNSCFLHISFIVLFILFIWAYNKFDLIFIIAES